jgi:hypothetical protein
MIVESLNNCNFAQFKFMCCTIKYMPEELELISLINY